MKPFALTITLRLAAGFGGLLLLLALVVTLGAFQVAQMKEAVMIASTATASAQAANDWLRLTETNLSRIMGVALSPGQTAVQSFAEPLIRETDERIGQIRQGMQADARLPDIDASSASLENTRKQIWTAIATADPLAVEKLVETQLLPESRALIGKLSELRPHAQRSADQRVEQAGHRGQVAMLALAMLGAAAMAIGIALAWAIARSITRPLRLAVSVARSIASNDLSRTVVTDRSDEIGELLVSLEGMRRALADMVGQVVGATENISVASSQISMGNADLSARTSLAAANLQQTSSAIHQLAVGVRDTATAATKAQAIAFGAAEQAEHCGDDVGRMVASMYEIDKASKEVAEITSVINALAFQSNILALNAAVEAARAGANGRGFAVVASEVRALAEKSGSAARRIKDLIERSSAQVAQGIVVVDEAKQGIRRIVDSARLVSANMEGISRSTSEQSQDIVQVNAMVAQLDQSTQQNAALVEQACAAAESLQDQAKSLVAHISVFQLDQPGLADATQSAALAVEAA